MWKAETGQQKGSSRWGQKQHWGQKQQLLDLGPCKETKRGVKLLRPGRLERDPPRGTRDRAPRTEAASLQARWPSSGQPRLLSFPAAGLHSCGSQMPSICWNLPPTLLHNSL